MLLHYERAGRVRPIHESADSFVNSEKELAINDLRFRRIVATLVTNYQNSPEIRSISPFELTFAAQFRKKYKINYYVKNVVLNINESCATGWKRVFQSRNG